ncbi:hypothetical protein AOLI_G00193380 [Acnodon oligacanthus]
MTIHNTQSPDYGWKTPTRTSDEEDGQSDLAVHGVALRPLPTKMFLSELWIPMAGVLQVMIHEMIVKANSGNTLKSGNLGALSNLQRKTTKNAMMEIMTELRGKKT